MLTGRLRRRARAAAGLAARLGQSANSEPGQYRATQEGARAPAGEVLHVVDQAFRAPCVQVVGGTVTTVGGLGHEAFGGGITVLVFRKFGQVIRPLPQSTRPTLYLALQLLRDALTHVTSHRAGLLPGLTCYGCGLLGGRAHDRTRRLLGLDGRGRSSCFAVCPAC